MSEQLSTIFFDLDGTLADTAPDLAAALNQLLTEYDKPVLPFETIRPAVSMGGVAMLRLGFSMDETSEEFSTLRQRFLDIYFQRLHLETQLFEGIPELLDAIEAHGLIWGVITNKPTRLTEPLLKGLGLTTRASCIVCGDTTAYSKPHPAPMLHALKVTDSLPEQSVYLGDAKRDVEAGKAAGMKTVIAGYGYLDDNGDIEDWGADGIIYSAAEMLDWITRYNR